MGPRFVARDIVKSFGSNSIIDVKELAEIVLIR